MNKQNCLVTGANRGIGLELTIQLLARGDRVVAACRHPGKATALNTLAGEHPGRLHVLPLDVADTRSIDAVVRELSLLNDSLPDACLPDASLPLDLLVNCAGVLHSGERFGTLTAANLEDSFRTNTMGPLLLTQALASSLAEGATVANISSQLGSITNLKGFNTPSYNISKAAQNMATALLAQALRDRGIIVLALHPGWVQTDMGGEDATVTPRESAIGLLQVIDEATPARSGQFLDWRGQTLPW